METVTIAIDKKTRQRLKQNWRHGDDTYDKIINKLLDESGKNE